MVTPFAPGAGVALDPRITESLGHQIGEARSMVSLAVGNHFFVRGNAELFEDLWHVGTDAQVTRLVHARGPFETHGAWDVSALGRQDFLAGILQWPTCIPDRQVGSAETALQVLAGSRGFVVQGQRNRAASGWRDLD